MDLVAGEELERWDAVYISEVDGKVYKCLKGSVEDRILVSHDPYDLSVRESESESER